MGITIFCCGESMKKSVRIFATIFVMIGIMTSFSTFPSFAVENSSTKVVFFLLDGCRVSNFERLIADGKLPTLARLKKEGLSVDCALSVFPTTTWAAYTPFVNGLYTCNSGICGLRWYYKKDGTVRDYCFTDYDKFKVDLNPDYPTIYELLPKDESLSVLGLIDRGSGHSIVPPMALVGKQASYYLEMDRAVFNAYRDATAQRLPRYSFVSFHAPDNIGHVTSVMGSEYAQSIVQFDGFLKILMEDWKQSGELSNVLFIFSADHGMAPTCDPATKKKIEIDDLLSREMGLKVETPPLAFPAVPFNSYKDRAAEEADVVICPNGNACLYLYLKGCLPDRKKGSFTVRPTFDQIRAYRRTSDNEISGDLINTLLKDPCVGLVMARDGAAKYRVFSTRGEGLIVRDGNLLGYSVVSGKDPLRMEAEGSRFATGKPISDREWLRHTCNEQFYPDAVFQIAQCLDAENSGDIVINAAVGYDPSRQNQRGSHGGLDRTQITVPLICWGKGVKPTQVPCARTVDVFTTVLKALGLRTPKGVPGIPLF